MTSNLNAEPRDLKMFPKIEVTFFLSCFVLPAYSKLWRERERKEEMVGMGKEGGSSWKVLCHFHSFVVVVQLLTNIQLFATPWTRALQVSLSFTISWGCLRFKSIESVMLSNYLILYHPLLLLSLIFPSIRVFSRVSSLLQMVKVLELQHQSFQRIFRAYTNTNTNSC